MKTILLSFFGAIAAEFIIIALATMMGLSGVSFLVAVALLPAGLILASIIYFVSQFFRKNDRTDKPD